MFSQLYLHPVRQIYDLPLVNFLRNWLMGGKFQDDLKSHLDLTEFYFILYKHGPYSFDLKDVLNSMQAGLIIQSKSTYPYGSSIYPGDTSAQIKENYIEFIEKYKDRVNFISEKISHNNVATLEKLTTAYYVIKYKSPGSDLPDMANIINQLKPHVSIEDATNSLINVYDLMALAKDLSIPNIA